MGTGGWAGVESEAGRPRSCSYVPPRFSPARVALWARRNAVYGTVAKMKLKPGAEEKMMHAMEGTANTQEGHVATYVFKSDADPNVHFITTIFESKSAYKKLSLI